MLGLNSQTAKRRCQRKSGAATSDDDQVVITVRIVRTIGWHRASPLDEHAGLTDEARKAVRTDQTAALGQATRSFLGNPT